MQAFHGRAGIKPKGVRIALAGAVLFGLLFAPVQAERLRISPDDLKLRVAVSEELSPALRREILELAKSVPVPVLIARMEQSELFSDEFYRRRTLLRDGMERLEGYIAALNPLIARAPYVDAIPEEPKIVADFPLHEVGTTEEGGVRVRRLYPAPKVSIGREGLRYLRRQAALEIEELRLRYDQLDRAEHDFLDEMSLLGTEVMSMRGAVRKWVTVPREGLPFSP